MGLRGLCKGVQEGVGGHTPPLLGSRQVSVAKSHGIAGRVAVCAELSAALSHQLSLGLSDKSFWLMLEQMHVLSFLPACTTCQLPMLKHQASGSSPQYE